MRTVLVVICLAATCRDSQSKGPPQRLPKEETPRGVLTSPKREHEVNVLAVVEGMTYAGKTGGCVGGEVPSFEGPSGASLDASAVFRVRISGFVTQVNGADETGGFVVGNGAMRKAIEPARADAKAGTIASCWNADASRIALRAFTDNNNPSDWVIVRFDAATPTFGVVILSQNDTCEAAIAKEPSVWHPSRRE